MPPSCPTIAAFACAVLLAGCGGGSEGDPAPTAPEDPFAAVDRAAADARATQDIPGMGLAIYDRDGRKRFERMYGDFAPDRRIAVASASKLVAGTTLLRLVDQGFLSLDSSAAAVLGWSGPQGQITLRHLLSFTSGLRPNAGCTAQAGITLAACVEQIAASTPVAAPGVRFDYGNAHLHVAARMAEVVTGGDWNAVFAQQLGEPLGLDEESRFFTFPRQAVGTGNPLVAGGLRISMNEYARLLELVFRRGEYAGNRLAAPALFDEQAREPYPDVIVGVTPLATARYGLAAWLECDTPATGCAVLSSPGAFGFTPWIDRDVGYFAIIGMEVSGADQDGVVAFSVELSRQLRPLIRTALGR